MLIILLFINIIRMQSMGVAKEAGMTELSD